MSAFTPIAMSTSTTSVPTVVPATVVPATVLAPAASTFRTQRTYRIFDGTNRISTAIQMADNSLLQVKPIKRVFATQAAWVSDVFTTNLIAITITCEETQVPLPYHSLTTNDQRNAWYANALKRSAERRRLREMKICKQMMDAKANETSMGRAIRAIFDQYGLSDNLSLRAGYRTSSGSFLSVFHKGDIVPVFFNRISGKIIPNDLPRDYTDNTMFFRRIGYSMSAGLKRIYPDMTKPQPGQKVIVLHDCFSYGGSVNPKTAELITKIQAKHYFVKVVQGGTWTPRFRSVRTEFVYDPSVYEFVRFDYSHGVTIFKNLPSTVVNPGEQTMTIDAFIASLPLA